MSESRVKFASWFTHQDNLRVSKNRLIDYDSSRLFSILFPKFEHALSLISFLKGQLQWKRDTIGEMSSQWLG